MIRRMLMLLPAAILLANCGTIPDDSGFSEVETTVADRTGHTPTWSRESPEDDAVALHLRELLAQGLTLEAAIQIALLNNPSLQARYEELGIAEADLVQAGLLENPTFSATVRFPDANEGSNNLEFAIAQGFLDFLAMPMRRDVAEAQFAHTKLTLSHDVLAFISELKLAWYATVAAAQRAELFHTVSEATGAASEFAVRQYEAGNLSRLEQSRESAFHADALLDAAHADLELQLARENLNRMLGIWGEDANWTLSEMRLPALPATEIPLDNVEAYAIVNRLDIAAAVNELETLVYGAKAVRTWRWLGLVDVAVSTERDTDGVYVTGPTLELQLPIFDQGRAKVARADAQLRAGGQRVTALAVNIRSEARAAREKFLAAREAVLFHERVLLPAHERIVQESQLHQNAMITGVYELLLDKRNQIDAARSYVEALHAYWIAHTELEAVCGGKFPYASPETSTQPTTEVPAPTSTSTSTPPQHQH